MHFSLRYVDFGGVNQIATRMETGHTNLILMPKIRAQNFKIPVLLHVKTYLRSTASLICLGPDGKLK